MSTPLPPAQPPYPQQPYRTAPATPGRGPAVAAVIVGAVPILLGGLWPAISIQLYTSSNYTFAGVVNAAFALFTCLIAVVALVLGILAARRHVAGRLLGGIAIGLGAAQLIGTVLSFASSSIASALY
ncbi:hypothetical protein Q9S36_17870 [Microbacterium sp. ARD31]|uniref:hypothetical protein n=1 Tax=Microbacterium sp. ARD31 TaxID=2962576 RepID=UPI0028815955|nr:hypothetical protein [Microbacterium sp. ARD31]MDT0182049.1 hypothetical protein [Microbacterium sp. ARD31]